MHHLSSHLFAELVLVFSIAGVSPAMAAPEANAAHLKAMTAIRAADVQELVDHLASDEMNGRFFKGPEAKVAAKYIAGKFEAAGLEPLGDEGTWYPDIEIADAAPNVVGVRRGRGERFLLITAHFDHLPPAKEGEDRIYNGADDNASGTAAILEIADAFAALEGGLGGELEASVVFVAFTGEESGLLGSRYFAEHPPLPLEHAIGILNLDMVSRGEANLLYCEGGDSAPAMLESIKRANETIGLDIKFGTHPEWMRQSDQWSLLRKGVPALYFGVDDHPDYHQVTDHADRIIPELVEKAARLTFLAAAELVSEADE